MINLNLLSPNEKNRLKLESNYLLMKNIIFVISLVLIIYILSLFATRFILQFYLSDINKSIENEQSLAATSKRGELEKSIKDLNNQLNTITFIQKTYVKWSGFLIDFNKTIVSEVKISTLQLDKNNKKVNIQGQAKTRNALLDFQKNLENLKYFSKITSPISNLLIKENIDFQFTGEFNDEIYIH